MWSRMTLVVRMLLHRLVFLLLKKSKNLNSILKNRDAKLKIISFEFVL